MAAPGTVPTIPVSITGHPRETIRVQGAEYWVLLDKLEQQITRDGGTWATEQAVIVAAGYPATTAAILALAKNADALGPGTAFLQSRLNAYADIAGE